jgi:membrane protease YdiL (CAAX protease family)
MLGITLLTVAIGMASGWSFKPLGEALGRLGLRRFGFQAIGWMLLAMFLYYLAAGAFAELVFEPEQEDIADELGTCSPDVIVVIIAVFLIAVVAPISEELFFRGFVFSGLRDRFSFWPAALIGGLIFGAIHIPTGPTTVIPLTVLGMVFCWIYEKTGSVWPCVIAHMINNSLALAVLSC